MLEDYAILLDPYRLLKVYAMGLFPMAPDKQSDHIHWYEPEHRGIIPMDAFRISRHVRRWMRNQPWTLRVNSAFEQVMQACAHRDDTWISPLIIQAYTQLHQIGHAHSVEIWEGERLTGGLYGVSLGGAFFGESMFRTAPDRDKVALCACHRLLQLNGFTLWDTQYYSEHLGSMGGTEIHRDVYVGYLAEALQEECEFVYKGDMSQVIPAAK